MSPPTEMTPLQGTPQARPSPPSIRYIIFYGFFLWLFLLCILFPFIPESFFPTSFLPAEFAKLQLCMLVMVDYVMDISWFPLKHVLEYAGSDAIGRQAEERDRRAIRKSESPGGLVKALLRFPPIISMIYLASKQLGWMFIAAATAYLTTTTWFTFVFLEPSARVVLGRKAERDDAL